MLGRFDKMYKEIDNHGGKQLSTKARTYICHLMSGLDLVWIRKRFVEDVKRVNLLIKEKK